MKLSQVLASMDWPSIVRPTLRFVRWALTERSRLEDAAWHELLVHTPLPVRVVCASALLVSTAERIGALWTRFSPGRRGA